MASHDVSCSTQPGITRREHATTLLHWSSNWFQQARQVLADLAHHSRSVLNNERNKALIKAASAAKAGVSPARQAQEAQSHSAPDPLAGDMANLPTRFDHDYCGTLNRVLAANSLAANQAYVDRMLKQAQEARKRLRVTYRWEALRPGTDPCQVGITQPCMHFPIVQLQIEK